MILDIFWTSKLSKQKSTSEKSGDAWSRSMAKAISWRILGTIDTLLIAYFISGKWHLALSIGLVEWVSKMFLYLVHERIWNRITWGK